MAPYRSPLLILFLWLTLVVVALTVRPLLPIDETRYVGVAWEMWMRGDFLVPHLNGDTYSHKPPLLFWIINAGWGVFGVNEWWPRLIAPLFGLGSLLLTAMMARRLWPDGKQFYLLAEIAPVILVSFGFWALFSTLTMFDLILTFFSLVALLGLVEFWRCGRWRGIALFALGIGLGVLTKGPAILVHTLPVALLAPWWGQQIATGQSPALSRWYLGIVIGVIGGAALALAWAIPAGISGGEAYQNAIFWGQSAGRITKSFAHQREWWWFVAALPPLLAPLVLWPALWRAIGGLRAWGDDTKIRKALSDGGVRFCLAWFVPAFLIFSAFSGKQPHYLLPEFPALAMIFAYLLVKKNSIRPRDMILPAALAIIMGIVVATALDLAVWIDLPPRTINVIETLDGGWGLALIVAGAAAMMVPVTSLWDGAARLAALTVAIVLTVHGVARPLLMEAHDLRPLARQIATWQNEGRTVANFGKYHGQYQFLGRLAEPLIVVGLKPGSQADFLARHPNGLIIAYHRRVPTKAMPLAVYRYRGKVATVWNAATVIKNPEITSRSSGRRP